MALLVIKAFFRIVVEKVPTMKSLGGSDASKKTEKPAEKAVEAAQEKIDFSNVKIEPLF